MCFSDNSALIITIAHAYECGTCCICPQYLGTLGCEYVVHKNDEITVEEIRQCVAHVSCTREGWW